jgi:hypothetical protein
MSGHLARVLWLQGFPDQAMRTAHSSVEDTLAANHTISFCVALAIKISRLAPIGRGQETQRRLPRTYRRDYRHHR